MRKIKIFITVLFLYEFVILTILQIHGFCNSFFNYNFCHMNNFKYFLMCIIVPGMIGLFIWWMPEIGRLMCQNKCKIEEKPEKSSKEIFHEILSASDVEKFIVGAVLHGIHNFATNHPKTTKSVDNILSLLKNTDIKNKKKKK